MKPRHWLVLAFCGLVLIAVALLIPAVNQAREAARKSQCHGQLFLLGFALQNYHDQEQSLPPAFVADAHGKPLSSWRVVASPYFDESEFFAKYDRTVAWSDSANRALADRIGFRGFACPSGPNRIEDRPFGAVNPRPYTDYVAITGPGTAFPGAEPVRFDQITDGLANTILLVEIANSDIHWTEPRDLHIDTMSFKINDDTLPSLSSPHENGPGVAFADGRYFRVNPRIDAKTLRALLTIGGGEPVDREELVRRGLLQ